jgi:hypothetical protein
MMEVLAAREPHTSVLQVWHRVQTSNAINDFLSGSDALHRWGASRAASGLPVIKEFMSVRSTGAIQLGHTYRDTENILLTIADEQGDGARIRQLLRAPGYVRSLSSTCSRDDPIASCFDRRLRLWVRKVDQAA